MINLSLPGEGVFGLTAAEAFIGGADAAITAGYAVPAAAPALGGGNLISSFFSTPLSDITIGQAIGGSLLTQGITGLAGAAMQGSKKMPGATPMPEIESPPTMPIPDDRAAGVARRRRIAEIQARSGRQSTFLSDEGRSDRLGAG